MRVGRRNLVPLRTLRILRDLRVKVVPDGEAG